ncbi:MAG: flavodoxin-dependent (E)-4-hydroxy-3-methylbut-2-enyl-diphosphate synthase [Clostridia bacterium]|nr:flavodoxin-dependent (E)-4-hydroxy-3-methylbut-2-enyl-diphosphate synthase [Clostridia bacterium]
MKRVSAQVRVGDLLLGGGAPVSIQTMSTLSPAKTDLCVEQIRRIEAAGCRLIRFSVPDAQAAVGFEALRQQTNALLVADVHFDYRLAVSAAEHGAHKIRINPGNIGSREGVKAVADVCRKRGIPIRIGINGGSLEKSMLAKYGGPTAEALAESALQNAAMLEAFDFSDIVLSVKSSSVSKTIEAYRLLAQRCSYPLHLGVTEAGGAEMGMIKSAIGIGSLLHDGIGDTLRVSLTEDPVREVEVGLEILSALGIRRDHPDIISCPTCGRCRCDVISLAAQARQRFGKLDRGITIAVMGCEVNGPGEAREADLGVACGTGEGLLFRKGKPLRKVPFERILDEMALELEKDE